MNNDSLDDANVGDDKVAFSSKVQLTTENIKREVVGSETSNVIKQVKLEASVPEIVETVVIVKFYYHLKS